EDVVQEAMLKAFTAREAAGPLGNPEGWLFRIAHNAALDFLRSRRSRPPMESEEVLAMVAAPDKPDPDIAAITLRTFLQLPPLQRSAVILKDVLGHSLEEIAAITGATEIAVKSALQRGRVALRELAAEPDLDLPILSEAMRERLLAYVGGFKTGDFDSVRAMLAEDVRLDLVAKPYQKRGKSEVSQYYGAYQAAGEKWAYAAGVVDGQAALLVYERAISLADPAYFVILGFEDGMVATIHDFLYARYAMEGVSLLKLD
ncbi:MAG TPA: RNA polymerase sigma factor, partial [Magnetospirillaceae bacterium]|nr:RNA polymerase sigma factor [Magnetospirillaceae bacterium]